MPSWTTWQSVCFCVLQASWLLSRKVQEVRWDKEQHSLCRLEVMLYESNTYQCCFLILIWFDFSWLRLICFEFFTFLWLSVGQNHLLNTVLKVLLPKCLEVKISQTTWQRVALATLMLLQHHQYRIVMIVQLFSHRIVLFEGDRTQILVAGLKTTKCQSP